MLLRGLVGVAGRIASTSSRNDEVSIAAELMSSSGPEEAYRCPLIPTGRFLPRSPGPSTPPLPGAW